MKARINQVEGKVLRVEEVERSKGIVDTPTYILTAKEFTDLTRSIRRYQSKPSAKQRGQLCRTDWMLPLMALILFEGRSAKLGTNDANQSS